MMGKPVNKRLEASVGKPWLNLFDIVRDGEIIKGPRVLKFFVELVTTVETIEFVNLVHIIVLWVHVLSAGVLLEDLEASFGVLPVLDEDSCWLTFFLIKIERSRSPPKQETGSFVIITTSILDLISMHPSEASKVFFLILKATVFAHLGYFRFIDVPFRVILGVIFKS